MTTDLAVVAAILIAARKRQMTQKQLGERIGVFEQQIQRYEATNYDHCSFRRMQEIAAALALRWSITGEIRGENDED